MGSKHKLKVLLIAYIDNNLNYTGEIESISALHCTTVVADVTIDADRSQKAAEIGDFDIVHFLAHGSKRGVLSSFDGVAIPESTILRICRDSGARCVFLNSCGHIPFAQRLVDGGVPAVVAYVGDLDDGVAVSHCRSFYRELHAVGDLRQAYDGAKDGSGHLLWLSNGKMERMELKVLFSDVEDAVRDVKRYIAILVFLGVLAGVIGSALI